MGDYKFRMLREVRDRLIKSPDLRFTPVGIRMVSVARELARDLWPYTVSGLAISRPSATGKRSMRRAGREAEENHWSWAYTKM